MCGIAGGFSLNGPIGEDAVRAMTAALVHRGPDDEGYWTDGQVTLGHRRLSIIDLAGSRQPMASPDGRYVLAFNGEILNYRDLRAQIAYDYRTQGDTEVVLAAHARRGADAPLLFAGQFAYALVDTLEHRLTLVRDRLGILPLFYWWDGHRLLFASELHALLAGLGTRPALDPVGLAAYLTGRSVPAPGTLLAGVRKLLPGHTLTVDAAGTLSESEYWSPTASQVLPTRRADEAVDALDQLLDQAVRRALVADVPVGAYLSGGVDSSLIAAKAAAARTSPVHTFCAEFGDPRVDESAYARLAANRIGSIHHVVPVRAADFADLWPWLSEHRGAPLSEPADVAVYRLAQAASEHVKVVLSGEGSDELFAGYPKHRYATLTRMAGIVPTRLREPLTAGVEQRLPPRLRRWGVALRALGEPTLDERIRGWFAPFTAAERTALLGGEQGARREHLSPSRSRSTLCAMLLADLHSWLPDNLLERGDRMTMAASIELRPPFLDRDVVDFALSLPPRLLVGGGQGKRLVKDVARKWVPAEIVDRAKSGFRVPLDAWFRQGLRDLAHDLVSDPSSVTRNWLDARAVSDLFRRHDSGRHDESIRIWTLASLEVWYQTLGRNVPRPTGAAGPSQSMSRRSDRAVAVTRGTAGWLPA